MPDIADLNTDDPFALDLNEDAGAITISEAAANRIAKLLADEADGDQMLRVTVSGGGCSGYQYTFSFDSEETPDDRVFERNGVKVVTDKASLGLLDGSEIDFVDDLIGAFFKVNNPNASSSCGCGTSFSI